MLQLLTLALLGTVAVVRSDFVATVLLTQYSNPDNRVLSGAQCDITDRFGRNCDIILKMCIEDVQRATPDFSCDGGYKSLGIVSQDADTLNFQPNAFYGDWPNPYRFFSDSPLYKGIRVKAMAYDANFGVFPDALIDKFYFDIVQQVGTNKYLPMTYSHPRKLQGSGTPLKPDTLKLSTMVQCTNGNNCASPPTTPMPTIPTTTAPSCNLRGVTLDIMDSLDASSNMGSSNYAAAQNFFINYVSNVLNIGSGQGQTQFSAGYYSQTQQCNSYYLFYNQNTQGIIQNIQSWSYVGGQQSDITQALNLEEIVIGGRGFRQNAKHMFILVGPGIDTGSQSQAIAYAQQISGQLNTPIYAICFGAKRCNTSFLNKITTSDKILVLNSKNDLQNKAVTWLNSAICKLTGGH